MDKKDLRIIFMGTPEFAVGTLSALVEGGYNVVAVVTQPDKPVGRHQDTLQPPAVKQYALAHGLPVLQPVKMKDPDFLEALAAYQADVQVVVAFRMLPEVVWAMPRFGTFNVHAALLPQYRGAAPINWAIINGERQTGVTTFFLDHDIDTGRVIMQLPFDIHDDYNVENVYDGLMDLGARSALATIDRMLEGDGHVDSMPQEEMVDPGTVLHAAPKIFKETCRINWQQSAVAVYNFVRGLSPIPGSWTTLVMPTGKSQVLKIYRASKVEAAVTESVSQTLDNEPAAPGTLCAVSGRLLVATTEGWLQLDEIQLSGKKRMDARSFLNGMRDLNGCRVE